MPLQDKTEPATQRRREDARNEGRVAKSADINSVVVLVVAMLVLKVSGPSMLQNALSLFRDYLANAHSLTLSADALPNLAAGCLTACAAICLPIMVGAVVVGITSNVLQVGLKVTPKALAPDVSRINPMKGLQRLFSARSAVELLKSVLKVGTVAYVVYAHLKARLPEMAKLADMPIGDMGNAVLALCWGLLIKACGVMLVIAALDYMYQRFHHEGTLKMTKQEVKEEFKRSEGDPQVRGRIRRIQREMSRNRMMSEVPRADVVVTNPTHIAVALKYDPQQMNAPVVLAKGQRLLAEKIKSLAEANGVPIVENIPVARLLYKTVDVGHPVPEELYQAVAEILAYVYRIGGRGNSAYRSRY